MAYQHQDDQATYHENKARFFEVEIAAITNDGWRHSHAEGDARFEDNTEWMLSVARQSKTLHERLLTLYRPVTRSA